MAGDERVATHNACNHTGAKHASKHSHQAIRRVTDAMQVFGNLIDCVFGAAQFALLFVLLVPVVQGIVASWRKEKLEHIEDRGRQQQ